MRKLLWLAATLLTSFALVQYASAATTFPVNGGTGSTTLSGIIKGAGTSPVVTAVNGIDFTLITVKTCNAGDFVSAVTAAGVFTCSTPSGGGGGSKWATSTGSTIVPNGGGGIIVSASSTIGNGTQAGGLTVSGGATTTGNAFFAGTVGVGTSTVGTDQLRIQAIGGGNFLNFVNSAGVSLGSMSSAGLFGAVNFDTGGYFRGHNTNTFLIMDIANGVSKFSTNTSGTNGIAFNYLTDGVFGLSNTSQTGFTRLDFGSTTSALFPAFNIATNTIPSISVGLSDGSLGGRFGVGSSTPGAKLGVHLNSLDAYMQAFLVASSSPTATTTLFAIDNVGRITAGVVNNSLYIGNGAGNTAASGASNVGIGLNALTALTNGTGAIAIGPNALASGTSTTNDIAIGNAAMQFYTTDPSGTQSNVAIGLSALKGVSGQSFGVRNVAIGERTLQANTTGSRNMALGYVALGANTTASDNSGFGYTALTANTIGAINVAIGSTALSAATSSSGNTALGAGAMDQYVGAQAVAVTSGNNVAVGERALEGAVAGMTSGNNVGIGQQAISRLTSGGANTAAGFRVGLNVSTGANNVLIGQQNAGTLTTGSNNTIIGTGFNAAVPDVLSASQSNFLNISNLIYGNLATGLGGNVGIGTTTPWGRLSIGGTAGGTLPLLAISSSTAAFATSSVFMLDSNGLFGIASSTPGSLLSLGGIANFTTATSSFYGTGGINLTSGCFAIAGTCLTSSAGSSASSTLLSDNNTFTGSNVENGSLSLGVNTNGLLLGAGVLGYASSTNQVTLFGVSAGGSSATTTATVSKNAFFGYFSGNRLTTALNNTLLGWSAGKSMTTSGSNTAVGSTAMGGSNTALTGSGGNTAVGFSALSNISGTAAFNTGLGDGALSGGSFTGSSNIGIGINAGQAITSASGDVIIGGGVDAPSATVSGILNIGNVLYGSNLYSTPLSGNTSNPTANGNIGVGTTTPWGKLSISMNSADTNPFAFTIASSTPTATTTLFAVANSGWIVTSGTKPTASSCGTGSVVDGNQTMGNVAFTGTLVTTCTITFPNAVPTGTTLQCVVSDDSTTGFPTVAATTTSSLRIGISAGLSAGTLYWHCQATKNDGN